MPFFIFLLAFLILLIILIILSSVIKFALFITTKKVYRTYELLLPAFLTFVLFTLCAVIWCIVLSSLLKENIFTFAINNYLMKLPLYKGQLLKIILTTVITIIVYIVAHSFVLLTVNIDYLKLKEKIMSFISKILKKEVTDTAAMNTAINEEEKELAILPEEEKKVGLLSTLTSSFFIFAILLFSSLVLFTLGSSLGGKYIQKLG